MERTGTSAVLQDELTGKNACESRIDADALRIVAHEQNERRLEEESAAQTVSRDDER